MSLLKRIFGKREPIQRSGGVDSLVKFAADAVHGATEEVWSTVKKDFPDQNRLQIMLVANLTLWSVVLDELCGHAPLWSPSEPQQFTNQILSSIVRHEWGSIDPETTEAMAGSLLLLLRGLRADREEEKAGKIEGHTLVFRACNRAVEKLVKRLPNAQIDELALTMAITPYYPIGALVNRTALEKVGAITKDGEYVG